jgi:hypothetical protein
MTDWRPAYRAMLREAEEKRLCVPPPYNDAAKKHAFVAGYEAALRDLASGALHPQAASAA